MSNSAFEFSPFYHGLALADQRSSSGEKEREEKEEEKNLEIAFRIMKGLTKV